MNNFNPPPGYGSFENLANHVGTPKATATFPASAAQEIVVDPKTGHLHQAGSDSIEGQFIKLFRTYCERDLYIFATGVMGCTKFVPHLHREVCQFVQSTPPKRKCILLPRDCFKTTIVSKCLPLHLVIQPKEENIYVPNMDGLESKILLSCEAEHRAAAHTRWIATQSESNNLLRALWPHKFWKNPKRDSKKWTESGLLFPRTLEMAQSDLTIQACGVGGVITGGHFNIFIKDDLVTLDASNSPLIMEGAIHWHRMSRALADDQVSLLEFIIGTRWAIPDLYSEIEDNDPSVQFYTRSLVEKGHSIFPELFPDSIIPAMRIEFGSIFALIYQNDPSAYELTDFNTAQLRFYHIEGDQIIFDEDIRDKYIKDIIDAPPVMDESNQPNELIPNMSQYGQKDMQLNLREDWFKGSHGGRFVSR